MDIKLNTKVLKNCNTYVSEINEDKAIMNLEKGEYFALNSIGSRIWDALDETSIPSEIINILIKEYDINEEKCTDSVLKFLNKLYEIGLLNIA
ncbi:PqqD family protein [Clostridium sp. D53t1_180928_C8]|uniref:PqqD family protein n=1 Tax=Clostridium sp. D53t1_180928_C8 TaxID=2787101 RepID=UPI0018AC7A26|nr:PqqD family protein [Clostridium sp. D53t1_180928_C8]